MRTWTVSAAIQWAALKVVRTWRFEPALQSWLQGGDPILASSLQAFQPEIPRKRAPLRGPASAGPQHRLW